MICSVAIICNCYTEFWCKLRCRAHNLHSKRLVGQTALLASLLYPSLELSFFFLFFWFIFISWRLITSQHCSAVFYFQFLDVGSSAILNHPKGGNQRWRRLCEFMLIITVPVGKSFPLYLQLTLIQMSTAKIPRNSVTNPPSLWSQKY